MATVKALLVGGGGINSLSLQSGGGGGGGVVENNSISVSAQTYSIVIGGSNQATTGFGLTANAGGTGYGSANGGNGGCGGGGGATSETSYTGGTGNQGGNGGTGKNTTNAQQRAGGGGGGAGGNGGNASLGQGGAGGTGYTSTISGTSTRYAGGGGGGNYLIPGAGVDGGGTGTSSAGGDGTPNTGGGAGGGNTVKAGGSGIVIIRYATADFGTCTGGTKTTVGSDTVHTFTSSGNFVVVEATAPTVTTQAVSDIASTTATGNGNVTADGGATITERGVCYSTSANPTTANNKSTVTGTTGAFTTSITSLNTGTLYYVRAYAINSIGTSYGSEVTFTTLALPTVTTQAVSSIAITTATGNGNITAIGGANSFLRGVATIPASSGDITFAQIDNPSFENVILGWTNLNGTVAKSSTTAKYGTNSCAVANNAGSYSIASQQMTISAGATITIGCWIKCSTGYSRIVILDDGTQYIGANITADNNWHFMTVTRTLAAANPYFWLVSDGDVHTGYFDGAVCAIGGTVTFTFDSGDYGTGAFTTSLTGLTGNTAYRTASFSMNQGGVGYGSTVGFTTLPATNIKSINGLVYASLKSVNSLAKASVKSFNGLS